MESFSTLPRPLVPVATNVATLVVLVSATVWSGAQRPEAAGAQVSRNQAITVPAQATPAVAQRQSSTAPVGSTALVARNWGREELAIDNKVDAGDAVTLQRVGYQTTPALAAKAVPLR